MGSKFRLPSGYLYEPLGPPKCPRQGSPPYVLGKLLHCPTKLHASPDYRSSLSKKNSTSKNPEFAIIVHLTLIYRTLEVNKLARLNIPTR
eukprot:764258-Hanusia_phi.AAC.2